MTPPPNTLRVLIVDDEKTIADTLTWIMRRKGFSARTAYSGEQAVNIALGFQPHAVVSDVMMRGMSGLQLAMWLKANCPNCKVLLVTGHSSGFGMIEPYLDKGYFDGVLPKPVHPTEILDFVTGCAPSTPALS
jgi:DNA-binding response OmpR family regulator